MQLFQCSNCRQTIYFDNTYCTACQCLLGFDAQKMQKLALKPAVDGHGYVDTKTQKRYKFCHNYAHQACNWVLEEASPSLFCRACELNQVIPDLSRPENHLRWQHIEAAKHRLIYALLRWNLPLVNKLKDPQHGLAFAFKANSDDPDEPRVLTGHAQGLITLNINEANDVERVLVKENMDEAYRTVLGHFRHEIGHYYWDLLIANTEHLDEFRQLFGDERMCYQTALAHHYQNGPLANWSDQYISAYATMHPWEDWAETWAHYLHIVDVLETANSFGLKIRPQVVEDEKNLMVASRYNNPYFCKNFEEIYQTWLPVSFAMNSLNRSMGQADFYPFVINISVQQKLKFIHEVIQRHAQPHHDAA